MVTWIDSCHHSGWKEREKIGDCNITKCCTIGVLVRDEPTQVVLAMSKADTGELADFMAIPRVAVKDIHNLTIEKHK